MTSRAAIFLAILFAISFVLSTAQESVAHRSGCHSWHSCRSDHGTYTCGDTGHCSQCPDNKYCLSQKPNTRSGESSPKPLTPSHDYPDVNETCIKEKGTGNIVCGPSLR
jgi:hypothetical protein